MKQNNIASPEDVAIAPGPDEDKLLALKKMTMASTSRVSTLVGLVVLEIGRVQDADPALADTLREKLRPIVLQLDSVLGTSV